jgi:hypothetical protein
MLTRAGAQLQVFLELRNRFGLRSGPDELVIVEERTIERPWGWVFFWTTRGWLNGDTHYALGGNAPILINRYDVSMRGCATSRSIQECIAEYERELSGRTTVTV